jgi:hypothetical protein
MCCGVSHFNIPINTKKNQKLFRGTSFTLFPWKEKIIKKINGEFKVMTIVHEYLWTS